MATYRKMSLLDGFEIPNPTTMEEVKKALGKVNKTVSIAKEGKSYSNLPLNEKLKLIKSEVNRVLGRYKGFVRVIYNKEEFQEYIDKAIKVDILALDTETNNSLDPITCKIMGLCLYIPNTRPVYVPINHCKPGTDELLDNQISEEDASRILKQVKEKNIKIVYHNGKFDLRVVNNTLGYYLPIWWDTMLASQLLNENERAGLKPQFDKYIDPTIGSYSIEKLFEIPYQWLDPEVFALYSAIDAYDTYKLYLKQRNEFKGEGMERIFNVFHSIETPVTLVVAHMEDDGITLDRRFVTKLNDYYHKKQEQALQELSNILIPYSTVIQKYQSTGELETPVNYNSVQQLEIILYNILGAPVQNTSDGKEGKMGTDEKTLLALNLPFTKTLLEYRHYNKMITAFTEAIPALVSVKDGKIHAHFNQMGREDRNVVTGRFSCSDPNLQQMPSREKVMRMMFSASTEFNDREIEDNSFTIKECEEVETEEGYKFARKLQIGDKIYKYTDDKKELVNIINVEEIDKMYLKITVKDY